MDVFISYPRADSQIPTLVKEHLEALGLKVFFDSSALDSGSIFATEIDRALKTASVIVACWSPAAFRSDWVMKECAIGLQRKVLAPIAIKPLNSLDVRVDFHGINYLDLTDYCGGFLHHGFERLVETIATLKRDDSLRGRLRTARVSDETDAEADQLAIQQGAEALKELAWTLWQLGSAPVAQQRRARRLYEAAVALGDSSAMVSLGSMCRDGHAGATDAVRARELFKRSAELGNSSGMNNYAIALDQGTGGPKDPAAAFQWYKRGAEAGGVNSIVNYAWALYEGRDGQPDMVAARKEFTRAAEAGSAEAMRKLANMLAFGEGGAKDDVLAREWYGKAAEVGDATAAFSLAEMIANGRGGPSDKKYARSMYAKGASGGNSSAMNNLGLMLESGEGGPEDKAEARAWYLRAAEAGNAIGMGHAGRVLNNGIGGPSDSIAARRYYEKGAAAGSLTAMYGLGIMKWNERDLDGAKALWREAAAKGHEASRMELLKDDRDR